MDFHLNLYGSRLGWPGAPATARPLPAFSCCTMPLGSPHLHPGLHPLLVTPWLVLSLVCGPISGPGVNLKVTLSFMVPIKH